MLLILVYYAAKHGASQLSFSFLTAQLPAPGGIVPGGGIGPALVGTAEVVLIATIIALPVGVLTAIYLSEFAGPRIGTGADDRRSSRWPGCRRSSSASSSAGLIVDRYGQSAIAAGLALAIVEVPLIARASIESLRRVPGHPARGGRRARRGALAHDPRRDPADRRQRHRHRHDPRGRPRRR